MDDRQRRSRVTAAQAGDQQALGDLISEHLPLIYNVVGRALAGHADVDDVVQETMLRAVHGIEGLRDPGSFRSWLVAIAMRQVRDRARARATAPARGTGPLTAEREPADPGSDFVDLTVLRLGLDGQRKEVAQATRWLDADDRELLALWWQEVAGELTRRELAETQGLTRQHAAVRVQRMKAQLETARGVVRALDADPRCRGLAGLLLGWDGRPGSVWRKRIARHLRDCSACGGSRPGLVPAERLLAGLALVPLPAGFALHALPGLLGGGGAAAMSPVALATDPGGWPAQLARTVLDLITKPAVAATAGVTLVAGGAYVVRDQDRQPPQAAPTTTATPTSGPRSESPAPTPSRTAAPSPTVSPSPSPRPAPPPGYGSTVDTADPAPDPLRAPGPLPRRPENGFRSSAGAKAVMVHNGDTVTLSGSGYFLVRWQIMPGQRSGALTMPTWTGLRGKLFHAASGGGKRMDDEQPGQEGDGPHTAMGSPATGFAVLPAGAQQMWQNEYFHVDGSVTLHQNESQADYNLIVMPATWESVTQDIQQAPGPGGPLRHGLVRDTGTDTAPVPQYLTRAKPPNPGDVPQHSEVD
ncbi:sigma-70 family RNA polymerase sigma factor [Streptomyces sp. NPDC088400]|uniref:sigma-70 family RNA polymerase sigma factor n=1 Tax=Streptomyces sp. NPDC088400 TaxID=3365861 RepID=UPI00382FA08D